jgi:hypothetical protein
LSSAVTSAAAVLWLLDTVLFNVQWPLQSVLLNSHYSSSHDYYMLSKPWKLVLLIHIIKWPFWLQMFKLNVHKQSVCFENLTSPPLCGDNGTPQHKQTKESWKILISNVLSVQPTKTVLFLYCLVFSLFCPSPVI